LLFIAVDSRVITLFSESMLLTTSKQDNKYDYVGAGPVTELGNCIASFRTYSLYVVLRNSDWTVSTLRAMTLFLRVRPSKRILASYL
jgi:hypothetical protein